MYPLMHRDEVFHLQLISLLSGVPKNKNKSKTHSLTHIITPNQTFPENLVTEHLRTICPSPSKLGNPKGRSTPTMNCGLGRTP